MAFKKCGAKTRSGGRCQQPGSGAGGRCKFHGGASPTGIASPHFEHGRYSKYLPAGLSTHYTTARADRDLVGLRDELALVDARIASLFERTKTSTRANALDGIWPQIENLIEQRRKLAESESRRMKDLHQMLSVERVIALMAYVQDSLRRHIVDRGALAAIQADLQKVYNAPAALAS
jgi:hypothetical protein